MGELYHKADKMKPLYTSVQHLDQRAYSTLGLSEDLLMEHAALALLKAVVSCETSTSILILSGPGNNGADGIVLARLLLQEGYTPLLWLPYGVKSTMAKKQLLRAKACGVSLYEAIEPPPLDNFGIIVDALFGSGLTRPIAPEWSVFFQVLKTHPAVKIACDLPSGLFDNGSFDGIFSADHTVTMGAAKEALFYDHVKPHIGALTIAPLGLPESVYCLESTSWLVETSDLKLPHRTNNNVHKGSFGHLTVLSGTMEGAPQIAALSALHFGSGLVTLLSKTPLHLPYSLMQSRIRPNNSTAMVLGMGLGEAYNEEEIITLTQGLPTLFDADLCHHQGLLRWIESSYPRVITPHPKEFCQILLYGGFGEVSISELQAKRFFYLRRFSEQFPKCVVVLKGATTLIAEAGICYVLPHGDVRLAKGGSGDVLAGVIGGLLAQGYSGLEAAIQGTLAHQLASQKIPCNSYASSPALLINALANL